MARLKNVEGHREALIKTLRDSPEVRASPADKQLASCFRVADEAVIFDCSATFASRPGRLFITCGHFWFHSQIIAFTHQKVKGRRVHRTWSRHPRNPVSHRVCVFLQVVPFRTVASVESSSIALGSTGVTVVDTAGERFNFLIATLNPPDFADRVYDVMQQVLELWRKEERRLQRAQDPLSSSGAGPAEDEEDMEVIRQLKTIAKLHISAAEDQNGSKASSPEPDLRVGGGEGLVGGDSLPTPPSPSGQGGQGQEGTRSRAGLRVGIQAFLQESQGTPRKPPPPEKPPSPLLDFS
jgi:hypothetical protein